LEVQARDVQKHLNKEGQLKWKGRGSSRPNF